MSDERDNVNRIYDEITDASCDGEKHSDGAYGKICLFCVCDYILRDRQRVRDECADRLWKLACHNCKKPRDACDETGEPSAHATCTRIMKLSRSIRKGGKP